MTKDLHTKLRKNETSARRIQGKNYKNAPRICNLEHKNDSGILKMPKQHAKIKAAETKTQLRGKKKKQVYPKRIWTAEEDVLLTTLVMTKKQTANWSEIAKSFYNRMGKQCRERWFNHLDPSINKEEWAPEEYAKLIKLHSVYGNKWSLIAKYLPGRTDNNIKNTWNTNFWKFHSLNPKITNNSVGTFDNSNEVQSSCENTSIENIKNDVIRQKSTHSPFLSTKSGVSANLTTSHQSESKFEKIVFPTQPDRCSFQKPANMFSGSSHLSIVFPIFNRVMLSRSFNTFSSFEENENMDRGINSTNSLYE